MFESEFNILKTLLIWPCFTSLFIIWFFSYLYKQLFNRIPIQIIRMSKRLNIPIKFHNLSHTHATMILEADVNIKVIQERLVRSDISTTLNVYSHITKKTEAEAIKKFESNLNI